MPTEHPTPQCPSCRGNRTRPLDVDHVRCFDCEIDFDLVGDDKEDTRDYFKSDQ